MSFDKTELLLYAVTDRQWLDGHPLSHAAEQALLGGASLVQLREKDLPYDDFLREADEIKSLCTRFGVPFIINDSVELALACNADGVHVGQSDMAAQNVRAMLGADKILGVSAQTVEQAIAAQAAGADYLGVGAVFTTSTKPDADFVPFSRLKEICSAVSIPVVAIGGINAHNILELKGSGICGVALVSSIFAEKDIKSATENMRRLAERMLKSED